MFKTRHPNRSTSLFAGCTHSKLGVNAFFLENGCARAAHNCFTRCLFFRRFQRRHCPDMDLAQQMHSSASTPFGLERVKTQLFDSPLRHQMKLIVILNFALESSSMAGHPSKIQMYALTTTSFAVLWSCRPCASSRCLLQRSIRSPTYQSLGSREPDQLPQAGHA